MHALAGTGGGPWGEACEVAPNAEASNPAGTAPALGKQARCGHDVCGPWVSRAQIEDREWSYRAN